MEFRDLKKQYQILKPEIDEAVERVMTSGGFILGKTVSDLENTLAEYVGVKHCITCANGTDALTLALKVWNVGPGDAVFVPDFTFFASAETIALEGATPVFVDVEKETFNISPSDLETKIRQVESEGKLVPKAVVAVDLFGLPADFIRVRQIADKHHLLVLEDGAQGFGGCIGTRRACSFGDIATTSFFPAKPLGCYGDGGAVFTDNDKWAELIKSYRVHGKGTDKYDNVRIGMNSRLDAIQAAILQVKFDAFVEYEDELINQVAQQYTTLFGGKIETPVVPNDYHSSWAQYTLRLSDNVNRAELQSFLKEKDIPTMVYYPITMHKQTAFKHLNQSDCPNAEWLSQHVLSLPMHPYLTDEEIKLVSFSVLDCLGKN